MLEEMLVKALLTSDADPTPDELDVARQGLRVAYDTAPRSGPLPRLPRPRLAGDRLMPIHGVQLLAVAAIVAAAVVLPLTLISSPGGQQAAPGTDMSMQLLASNTSPFQAVGADPGAFYLQCVTESTCYGTSGLTPKNGSPAIYRTDNGGSTWVITAPLPLLLDGPLACTSATNCMAAVTGIPAPGVALPNTLPIATTINGGTSWMVTRLALPPGLDGASIGQVACATRTQCVVYLSVTDNTDTPSQGAFFTTSDAGTSWTQAAPVAGIEGNDVSTLHCAADGTCIGTVISGSVPDFDLSTVTSNDFGASWSPQPSVGITSGGGSMFAVCGDTQHCMSLYSNQSGSATTIAWTADAGSTWHVTAAPAGWRNAPLDLSCPTGTDCFVSTADNHGHYSDPVIESTTDGGMTWSTLGVPTDHGAALGSVQPLSCPSASGCLGVAALPEQPASLLVSSLPSASEATS